MYLHRSHVTECRVFCKCKVGEEVGKHLEVEPFREILEHLKNIATTNASPRIVLEAVQPLMKLPNFVHGLMLLPCLSGRKSLRLIWLSDLVSLCLQLVHRPKLATLNHFLYKRTSDVKFKLNSQSLETF